MRNDAESTSNGRDGLHAEFLRVVSAAGDGGLMMPVPFDLSTSGYLAGDRTDADAVRDCRYEVVITALSPVDGEPMRREVLNTVVPSTPMLIAVLDGLLDELETRLGPAGSTD